MTTQDKDKSKGGFPALILLPVLILAGLLAAPPTRSLLKTQCVLLFDSTAFASRLRDLGVKNGPMPTVQKWEQSRPAEVIAHSPDDYTIQVAGVLLSGANTTGNTGLTSQEHFAYFQHRFGAGLTALSLRFPDHPGPYAHYLRFMTMGTVRVSRDGEAASIRGQKSAGADRQVGGEESWAAYDNAAVQGEKVDPDNAYFPLMRAIGLFDAKRDAEGIAAVLRAGQKKRFEDYSLEEPAAAWALYRRTYGIDEALLRESTYAAVLLPHLAAIRSMGRLVVAKAVQAERASKPQEGLALRHAMMQSAVRMREQGGTLNALVGSALFSMCLHSPGGVQETPLANNATDEERYTVPLTAYLAYLRRIGQADEAVWVEREAGVNTEVRKLIQASGNDQTQEAALLTLPGFWIGDMLLLANTLGILGLCGIAVLLGRPNLRIGEKALPWAALLVLVCCMIVAFQMQWAESLTQLRMVLDNLSFSPDGSSSPQEGMRVSDIVSRFPGVIHVGEALLSLAAPLLALIAAGMSCLFRKEPYSAALLRGLQRGALVFATLLTAGYALMLISTARLEAEANASLDARIHNEVASLRTHAQSSHKP